MTKKFDTFITQILCEAERCKGPTLRQLSDNPRYKWSRCAPNPYSSGFKRIYWGKHGEKYDIRKCKRAKLGSANYEECKDIKRALERKIRRLRHAKLINKK
jgi:hypothetical protein